MEPSSFFRRPVSADARQLVPKYRVQEARENFTKMNCAISVPPATISLLSDFSLICLENKFTPPLTLIMQLPKSFRLILTIALFIASTRAGQTCTNTSTGAGQTCTNGGESFCCQATVAGDTKIIQAAATLAGYELDPNDITCILSESNSTDRPALQEDHCGLTEMIARAASKDCPGVYACCQLPLVRQK